MTDTILNGVTTAGVRIDGTTAVPGTEPKQTMIEDGGWIVPGGATLRQWYAGLAMQGLLAGRWNVKTENGISQSRVDRVIAALAEADALIAALKVKP